MKEILKEILVNILAEHGEKNNLRKEYWKEELNVDSIVDAIPLRKLPSEDKKTFVCKLTNSRGSNVYRTTSEIVATEEEIEWYAKGMMDTFLGTTQKRVNIYVVKDDEYEFFKTI